jgi:hypothetical protein
MHAAVNSLICTDRGAALIAWLPIVRVDGLVKDRRPPKAAALRAVLDKSINTNNWQPSDQGRLPINADE